MLAARRKVGARNIYIPRECLRADGSLPEAVARKGLAPLGSPPNPQTEAEEALVDAFATGVLYSIDDPEGGGGNVRVGVGEVRGVGEVEGFGAELEIDFFRHAE